MEPHAIGMFLSEPLHVRRVGAAIATRPSPPVGTVLFHQHVKHGELLERRSFVSLKSIEVHIFAEKDPKFMQGIQFQLKHPIAIDLSIVVQCMGRLRQAAGDQLGSARPREHLRYGDRVDSDNSDWKANKDWLPAAEGEVRHSAG
jgi:hypothetical protein